jgi:2-oxoisovalerate dehydrogenase E1 component
MASTITELAFDELDAPPVVLGARNWITPPDESEDAFFPYPPDFLDTINEHLVPLKGYNTKRVCSLDEIKRRAKMGL